MNRFAIQNFGRAGKQAAAMHEIRARCVAMARGDWAKSIGVVIYFAGIQAAVRMSVEPAIELTCELLDAWRLNDGAPPDFRTWWAAPAGERNHRFDWLRGPDLNA